MQSKMDSIKDANADAIKWTKQFDTKNKAKWQFLKKNFTKINLNKIEEVIPYKRNDRWGYMDKMGNTLTKPLFEYADFASQNGLLFIYNTKYFYYNKKGQIDKLLERNDDGKELAMKMPDDYYELTNTPGFTIKNNQIAAHSSDYVQIGLLNRFTGMDEEYKNYLQGKTWAIVKNKFEKIAIIDSAGNPLNKVYNFEYSMDRYADLSDANYKLNNKVFFVLKDLSENKLLFELNGNAINTEKPVYDCSYFYNYNKEFDKINLSIYCNQARETFKIYYTDHSQNLLIPKNGNLELAFTKFYNEIIGYNGVCKERFDGYEFYEKDIKNLFILAKDANEIFYVDMDGKEHKLKN